MERVRRRRLKEERKASVPEAVVGPPRILERSDMALSARIEHRVRRRTDGKYEVPQAGRLSERSEGAQQVQMFGAIVSPSLPKGGRALEDRQAKRRMRCRIGECRRYGKPLGLS